jgi:phage tail tape-measure protein
MNNQREGSRQPDREVETVRPLGTPTVATPGDVIRAQSDEVAAGAPRDSVLSDPALAATSDTGMSDRAKDFGEPAPDRDADRLGEPQTNTGAFAGAVAGAVLGGVAGPVGAVAGAAIGGVVGGAAGAAMVRDPDDTADDAGAAGDVADVDSDKDRVKRTYSGQVYEAGSPADTARKDVI